MLHDSPDIVAPKRERRRYTRNACNNKKIQRISFLSFLFFLFCLLNTIPSQLPLSSVCLSLFLSFSSPYPLYPTMKFEEYLLRHAVPEWQPKYINYSVRATSVKKQRMQRDEKITEEPPLNLIFSHIFFLSPVSFTLIRR